MRKTLKIFFNEPLHQTSSGFSLGKTEFSFKNVAEFNQVENALLFKRGWRVLLLAHDVEISNPGSNVRIVIADKKIKKIEVLFDPRNS